MAGKKRKASSDLKEVAAYLEKLQKRPAPPPMKLSNNERKNYTFKSPYPQEFSIPSNIIYYVAKNPAFPKGHLKLMSTCKSLARMSRILPVSKLVHQNEHDFYKWKADNESINLKNQFFKLWILQEVQIWNQSMPNLASTLVKHIHKFSLRRITVLHQVLTFEELQVLVSGAELDYVQFEDNVVKNSDGNISEFEKVFELLCCKKLKIRFHPEYHGIGANTISKIIEILSSEQIPIEQSISFFLWNIPQNFELPSFFKFLKANMTGRQHSIFLYIVDDISDAKKQQLQNFVNEIIQMRGIEAHTVPIISFPGYNDEAFEKLCEMRYEKVEGILRKSK